MDTSDVVAQAGKEIVTPQPGLNVGMTLREARERVGMSVDDVAERIKFSPKQVEALESNDFAHLPQTTFLRGFVRSYARVLQLDEVALLAALPVDQPKQVAVKASGVDVPFPRIQALQNVNLLWLGGALGVALLLGLFAWWDGAAPKNKLDNVVVEPLPLPVAESAAVSATAAAEPADISAPVKVGAAPRMVEPVKVATAPKVVEPVKVAAAPKVVEPVKAKPPVVAVEPKVAVAAPAADAKSEVALETLKRRPLHFIFNEEVWAEVIDANGVVLLSRSNPRGSEKWIGGPRRAPYEITIANPASVKLYYKGKEVDLSPYAEMGTAHLKVE